MDASKLFEMVQPVDDVEPPPLMDRKRAKDLMGREPLISEFLPAANQKLVHRLQGGSQARGYRVPVERLTGGGCGDHPLGGWTAGWQVSESANEELLHSLIRARFCLGRIRFAKALAKDVRGAPIGEDQMLDNLASIPSTWIVAGVGFERHGRSTLQSLRVAGVKVLERGVHR